MKTELVGAHGPIMIAVGVGDVPTLIYDGWEITLTRGAYDGVPVLFIDTARLDGSGGIEEDERGPRCRILLNDEPVWANPAFSLPEDAS